jgi:hypothetical protein
MSLISFGRCFSSHCARRSGAERRRAQNCDSRAAHRLLERGRGGRGASGREHREGVGDGRGEDFRAKLLQRCVSSPRELPRLPLVATADNNIAPRSAAPRQRSRRAAPAYCAAQHVAIWL